MTVYILARGDEKLVSKVFKLNELISVAMSLRVKVLDNYLLTICKRFTLLY